jgi:hypothetical protein
MGNADSRVQGKRVYDSRYPDSRLTYYNDGQIIYLHTRASRLSGMHGSYSWAATLTTNILTLGTNDPL